MIDYLQTIEIATKVAAFPVPGHRDEGHCCRRWRGGNDRPVGDGDLTSWSTPASPGPTACEIEIFATKSCELGPLGLYRDCDGRLALIGVLNGGRPIVIQRRQHGRSVGHVEIVRGARFDRLILGGYLLDVEPSNGALVSARATPIYGAYV